MDVATAEIALYSITAVSAAIWVGAALFVRSRARAQHDAAPNLTGETAADLSGERELDGRFEALGPSAVTALTGTPHPQLGTARVLESSRDRVVFELLEQNTGRRVVRRAELTFTNHGNRTLARWQVYLEPHSGLLLSAKIVTGVGLITLVAGFFLMREFVVNHPSEHVRGQVFQMAQCIHFLWPPFLLAGLHGARKKMVETWFDTLLHNLPHLAAA